MFGKRLSVLLCTALQTSALNASVSFADDFSYPDGALVVVSGGQWKTHSGTAGQVQVTSGQVHLSQTKSEDVSVPFPGGPLGPTNAAALYARFDINFRTLPSGSAGGYFAHFKDASATTGIRCRIFASTNGAAAGCFRLGISSAANTPNALAAQDLALHTRYQVVCRLDLGNNASTLWLNPAAERDSSVTSSDEPTVKAAVAFAWRQSLASGAGMGELTVDNLVIATSFEEVAAAATSSGLTVAISWTAAAGIKLSWPADPAESYSVWMGDSVAGSFSQLITGMCFLDGAGFFDDGSPESALRFYRVCSP